MAYVMCCFSESPKCVRDSAAAAAAAACTSQLIFSICFTALAHYHAAISIDINDPIANEDSKREFRHYNNNSIALSDLSTDADVHPCALKKAHIKEAIACHEEAQRLQRMSRDLKVRAC